MAPTFYHVHPSVRSVPIRGVWNLLLGRDDVGKLTLEGTERNFLCGPEVDCEDDYLLC